MNKRVNVGFILTVDRGGWAHGFIKRVLWPIFKRLAGWFKIEIKYTETIKLRR